MNNPIKLGSLTDKIGSGATPTGGDSSYSEEGVALIRSQNVQDMMFLDKGLAFINDNQAEKLKGVTVESNDILLNITGDSIARCCIVPDSVLPARVNQHVSIIRCKDKESSHYVSYYIQYLKDHLLQICRVGGTRNALTKDVIENIQIDLPNDHKARARVVTALNNKVDIHNQINIELDNLSNFIYDYWFVQFNFPDANGRPYKSSGGKMVYNEVLKKEIPEKWGVGPVSGFIARDKSGDWGQDQSQGNYTLQVSCVRGADINGMNGIGEANPPIRFILDKNSAKLLSPYDLIVEISGGSPTQSTGRLAYITEETLSRFSLPLICSNFCKGISLKNANFFYYFIYLWNYAYNNGVLFRWEGKTSGIKNFLFEPFTSNYQVLIPSEEVAKSFFDIMQPIHSKKQLNLAESKKMAELRDWLLPLLMSGQVKAR